jgi:hypothetical protein
MKQNTAIIEQKFPMAVAKSNKRILLRVPRNLKACSSLDIKQLLQRRLLVIYNFK